MRIKIKDDYDDEIKGLVNVLGLESPNQVMNLFVKRHLAVFKQWAYQPVQPLSAPSSDGIDSNKPQAKVELIDSDLPPFEM